MIDTAIPNAQPLPAPEDDNALLIQQMAALGISPEMLAMLTHQIGRGENLQDTPMAQGQRVGNTYVAASPLEHMANALRQYKGAQMAKEGKGKYADQLGQNQQGIAAFGTAQNRLQQQQIDALNRRLQGAGTYQGAAPELTPDPVWP